MKRRAYLLLTVVLLVAGSVAACGDDLGVELGDPPLDPVAVSVTARIPYMTDSQRYGSGGVILSGDSYTVMNRFVPEGDGPWPVVVLLHGGKMDAAAGLEWVMTGSVPGCCF